MGKSDELLHEENTRALRSRRNFFSAGEILQDFHLRILTSLMKLTEGLSQPVNTNRRFISCNIFQGFLISTWNRDISSRLPATRFTSKKKSPSEVPVMYTWAVLVDSQLASAELSTIVSSVYPIQRHTFTSLILLDSYFSVSQPTNTPAVVMGISIQ